MTDYGSNNIIISELLTPAVYTDMTPPIAYKGTVYYDFETLISSTFTGVSTTTLYQTGQIFPTLKGGRL